MANTFTQIILTPVPEWKGKLSLGSNHSYWWHEKGKKDRPLSGITTVLNVIAKPALIPWAAKMVVEYIKKTCATVPTLDGSKFYQVLEDTLDKAQNAHKMRTSDAADKGKDAHALVEEYIKECISNAGGIPVAPVDADPRVHEFAGWAATQNLTFIASEVPLADPKLSIAGTPDFIALKDGLLVIGDLKTGSGIYDRVYFAQMAAYGYMWMHWKKQKGDPKLVIVHMPAQKPNQPMAEYWSEDWKGDWAAFKAALILHRWKDNFNRPNY